jgi:hypothetical protein
MHGGIMTKFDRPYEKHFHPWTPRSDETSGP